VISIFQHGWWCTSVCVSQWKFAKASLISALPRYCCPHHWLSNLSVSVSWFNHTLILPHVTPENGFSALVDNWCCRPVCEFQGFLGTDLSLSVLTVNFRWTFVSRYQNVSILAFIRGKGDGGDGKNLSHKTYKVPAKLSPLTNQHPVCYRLDALPVAQPTVSKHRTQIS